MKVLFLTNIEVPYRVKFFNELSKGCDLTVLYERRKSRNRDSAWSSSEKRNYEVKYLDGWNIGNEYSFSLKICHFISQEWDVVIVGCYNSLVQMLAIIYMRMRNIPFIVNLDGEPFIESTIKGCLKTFILKGARAYLTAGTCSAASLKMALGNGLAVVPYFFSSLTSSEITKNGLCTPAAREKTVLVIGQYFKYKGLDIAYQVAKLMPEVKFKFVGMGNRSSLFVRDLGG